MSSRDAAEPDEIEASTRGPICVGGRLFGESKAKDRTSMGASQSYRMSACRCAPATSIAFRRTTGMSALVDL